MSDLPPMRPMSSRPGPRGVKHVRSKSLDDYACRDCGLLVAGMLARMDGFACQRCGGGRFRVAVPKSKERRPKR